VPLARRPLIAPPGGRSYNLHPVTVSLTAAKTLFASDRFSLVEEGFATPDGAVTRAVIHHPGAVAVVAEPSPGSLLMVRQYRYPVRRETLEIPAGTRVVGEAPERTAARELQEEAGFLPGRLVEWCRFLPAAGVSDEEMILYRATGLTPTAAAPEHGELVAPEVITRAQVPGLIANGLIADAKTLIALALLGWWPEAHS